MNRETVIIVDFGGHSAQDIARKIRFMGVYTEIVAYTAHLDKFNRSPKAIVYTFEPSEADEKAKLEEIKGLGLPTRLINNDIKDDDIKYFLKKCGCNFTWSAKTFVKEEIEKIKAQVCDKKVLCALSGGVDSAVTAALIHEAIGDQISCVFVDTGLMRYKEGELVVDTFVNSFKMNLVAVDAEERFLGALKGITEPEKKRKIIGELFIRIFEEEAKKLGHFDFLAQGTLYPDIVESVPLKGQSTPVKSHHNVGGLPEDMKFLLVEPLKELFKDEVREVGKVLGLSDDIVYRHPFPGPGLAVRILGEITKERCDILRKADYIAIEEIKKAGLYRDIWQAFCVLLPVRSVGAKKGLRTYDNVAALRAVNGRDGMTADWSRLPHELLAKISQRILNEVDGINRLVYDISSKPPATIEWE